MYFALLNFSITFLNRASGEKVSKSNEPEVMTADNNELEIYSQIRKRIGWDHFEGILTAVKGYSVDISVGVSKDPVDIEQNFICEAIYVPVTWKGEPYMAIVECCNSDPSIRIVDNDGNNNDGIMNDVAEEDEEKVECGATNTRVK